MTTIDPYASSKYIYTNPTDWSERAVSERAVSERTVSPPISPQNQTTPHSPSMVNHHQGIFECLPLRLQHSSQSIYSHITIQYAILIKQFITQMVFVKFNQRIIEQTNQTLEFMTCRSSNREPDQYKDRQKDYHNIYQKILWEHNANNLPEIWDEIFAEHNIDILFRYLVDLINHLTVYSANTTTSDPKYIYSQQTIRKHFLTNNSRVIYLPETYTEYTKRANHSHHHPPQSYIIHQCAEHEKQMRNSILGDVFGYIFKNTLNNLITVDPKPLYVYLEHYARRLKQYDKTNIFDKDGNLEITESLLHKYQQAPTTTTYYEIYTIWLLDLWLK